MPSIFNTQEVCYYGQFGIKCLFPHRAVAKLEVDRQFPLDSFNIITYLHYSFFY